TQQGPGLPSGGQPQKARAESNLANAYHDAMNLLVTDKKCAAFFNPLRTNIPAASVVLQTLMNGRVYGSIQVSDDVVSSYAGYVTSATTSPSVVGPVGHPYMGAEILINDRVGVFVSNSASAWDRTVALLHELGHAMQILYPGSAPTMLIDGTVDGTPVKN